LRNIFHYIFFTSEKKERFPSPGWGFLLLGHKKESEELLIFKPQTLIQLVQDF